MSGRLDHRSSSIDLETLTVKPSPQRIRNILTLEERVAAIQAYSQRPMYTKVAKMFNCSWEQIKNIIANRQAIMEFYDATKSAERQMDPQLDEARKSKINFLGECVYEYIQRLQFHNKVDLNEELIRCKALEFRDIMRIDGFIPNRAWINQFKANFNFSLSNRQLCLTRAPPSSLDLRDIMTFCTKKNSLNKVAAAGNVNVNVNVNAAATAAAVPPEYKHTYRTSTMLALCNESESIAEQLRQRRQRKINFLERALLEFATRSKFHLKLTFNDERLCETANSLRDILKIDNFQPNLTWLRSFKARYNFDTLVQGNLATSTRTPPLSLDLRDILSYCSRLEKNSQIGAADGFKCSTNAVTPPATVHNSPLISAMPQRSVLPAHMVQLPYAKKSAAPREIPALNDSHKPLKELKSEIIDLADDEQPTKRAIISNGSCSTDTPQPALKIRKIESMCAGNEMAYVMQHSPGHWSEPSDKDVGDDNDDDDENNAKTASLPKAVRNYADALKLLKPLEEFAMLEENYRAIGLIEQLESIFKNPPSKDEEDEVDN